MSAVEEKIKSYPVTFSIDYPGKQSRLKALFRIILVLPIYLFLLTFSYHINFSKFMQYYMVKYNLMNPKVMATAKMQALKAQIIAQAAMNHGTHFHAIAYSFYASSLYILVPVFLMVVFRKKYPQWLFVFNTGLLALVQRMVAFLYCLSTEYPNTDQEQSVHLNVQYPEEGSLSRFLPFIKWLLLIPHYICLIVLFIVTIIVGILGWICVVFTGSYPKALFEFVEGFLRWMVRVGCYGFLLMTDEYPPFSLK